MPRSDIAATVRAFSRASVSATSRGWPEATWLFDRALVEMRGPRLDRNAGGFEQRAAHLALRGKDKRLAAAREASVHDPESANRFSEKIMHKAS